MILGYGIIAVPTGIVTAEYVKSYKPKTTTKEEYLRVCPHCMAKHQAIHANYCYNCGEEL
jgi:voltage-gated potassium channel